MLTDTLFAVGARLESVETLALIRALGVHAMSVFAKVRIDSALVNVPAVICHAHLRVALRTNAHERSD